MDLREQNKYFSNLCAGAQTSAGISSSESRTTGEHERAEFIWGELISGNYFDVMSVKPQRVLFDQSRVDLLGLQDSPASRCSDQSWDA